MKRNEIIFQQHELDEEALYHTIKWRVALWSRAWEYPHTLLTGNAGAELLRYPKAVLGGEE